jgi:effector-binding domain-containing protein
MITSVDYAAGGAQTPCRDKQAGRQPDIGPIYMVKDRCSASHPHHDNLPPPNRRDSPFILPQMESQMPRLAAVLALLLSLTTGLLLPGSGAMAQTPPAPAPAATPTPPSDAAQPSADPFGETVVLPQRTIVYLRGEANWDTALETLVEKFKLLHAFLRKAQITPSGPAMTVYTQANDTGFNYQAALPVAEAPKEPPTDGIAIGTSPGGDVLKFVHRGAYDTLDITYEAITNELDRKNLDAKDMFIEEYVTDLTTAAEDKLVINIYVPTRTP